MRYEVLRIPASGEILPRSATAVAGSCDSEREKLPPPGSFGRKNFALRPARRLRYPQSDVGRPGRTGGKPRAGGVRAASAGADAISHWSARDRAHGDLGDSSAVRAGRARALDVRPAAPDRRLGLLRRGVRPPLRILRGSPPQA